MEPKIPPVSLVFCLTTTGKIEKGVRIRKKEGSNLKELEKEIPEFKSWLFLKQLKKDLPEGAEIRILKEFIVPGTFMRIYECEVLVEDEEISEKFHLSMETAFDLADALDIDRDMHSIIKRLALEVYNTVC